MDFLKKHSLTLVAILTALCCAPLAWAQMQTILVGTDPYGNTHNVLTDTTGHLLATSPRCLNGSLSGLTTVGVAALSVPSVSVSGRVSIRICLSAENSGTPLVKCRPDGVAPIMGAANLGEVLSIGDCVTYELTNAVSVSCISDTANVAVTSYECTN